MGRAGQKSNRRGVSIRRHKNQESIQVNFLYKGERCRETIALPPTAANLQYASDLVAEIRNHIVKGTFDYAQYFPNSPKAKKFAPASRLANVGKLLDAYIIEIEKAVANKAYSPVTLDGYKNAVRHHLKPKFGHLSLDELTPKLIRDWLKSLSLTSKTIQNTLIPLRGILDDAVNDEIIDVNPIARVALKRLLKKTAKKSTYQIEPFNPLEVQAIVSAAEGQTRNLVQFAFETGLRISELIGLRWSDVNFAERYVLVSQAVVKKTVKTPKTLSGKRRVHLSASALSALQSQRQWSFLQANRVFHHPKTNQPIIADQQIRGIWKTLLQKAKVKHRPPYQTRHTFASTHLSQGRNPWWVAEQMGHETVEMVIKNYSKWIPEANEDTHRTRNA